MVPAYALPLLAFVAATCLGAAVVLVRAARRAPLQQRLGMAEGTQSTDAASPLFEAVGQIGKLAGAREPSPTLRMQLAQAGYHNRSAATIYIGAKLLLLAAGLTVFGALIMPIDHMQLWIRVVLVAWLSAAVFLIPNLFVHLRRSRRCQEVRMNLPNVLDLLEICVSAGMGLDLAWNSVTEEIRDVSPVLADEMALTNFEIHLNAPRAAAMRHMAERTGAEEISSLAAVLVQSDRFGTSIGDALRASSSSMREVRSRRAEEAAEKMVIKLLFPMILLIFPAILIVVCGPATLRWVTLMSGH